MQNSAFSIENILGRDKSRETRQKATGEAVPAGCGSVRRPILLPRVEPMLWRSHGCCVSGHPTNEMQVLHQGGNTHVFQGRN